MVSWQPQLASGIAMAAPATAIEASVPLLSNALKLSMATPSPALTFAEYDANGSSRGPHAAELVSVGLALAMIKNCLDENPRMQKYLVKNDNLNVVKWVNGTVDEPAESQRFMPLIDAVAAKLALVRMLAAPAVVDLAHVYSDKNAAHGFALLKLRAFRKRKWQVQTPIHDHDLKAALDLVTKSA